MANLELSVKTSSNINPEFHGGLGIGRVLVVEDVLVNQEVIAGMLRVLGVDFDTADNGEEALSFFENRKYGLVLMDVQMPVMDGLEATVRIREMEKLRGWPRLPVVALTGFAEGEERESCKAAGMDDFLTKPLRMDRLRQLLGFWGDGHGLDSSGGSGEGSVNRDALEQLKRLLVSVPGRYQMVLERYLDSSRRILQEIGLQLESGNIEAVYRAAHQLKSQSASVGVKELSNLSAKIETLGRMGTLVGVEQLLAQALRVYSNAEPILIKEIADS